MLVAPILTKGQNAIPADSILKSTQSTKVDSILQKVENPKIGLSFLVAELKDWRT
ncbi:hypothetical protein JCM19294_2347 [Nonlabens tegetincola]|uniref:Uncharacterized protein n=1 Tax=Nonlabens tegetincola TaxID=323273 RepID=A0A090PXT8_9FLAO|nr:hypothetical protein JCM19294_2347 [Nonlabens tegetincola]